MICKKCGKELGAEGCCREKKNCHDCAAKPGEMHMPGCDTERCPVCGGQAMCCLMDCPHCDGLIATCNNEAIKEEDRIPWSGIWPGVVECQEYDLWCKMVPGKGWVECTVDDPESREDLNRLCMIARWSRDKKKFVKE